MKNPRFWIAVLAAGVVCNVMDFFVQNKLLTDAFYSNIESMRQDTNPAWFVFGDFVAVFVLAWVFTRVATVFGAGAKGGAAAGFSLGVLVNFPTHHFIGLLFKGVPYTLVWANTLFGIAWYVIAGAILGALLSKPAAPSAG